MKIITQLNNTTFSMNNQEINVKPTVNEKVERKTYTKPELKKFGSLSELVLGFPGVGGDGGVNADCTLS